LVEPTARFENIKIPLREPAHGLEEISGVLGIPEWWPTGSRVAVAMAHGSSGDMNEPVLEQLHRELTARRFLALRFNFPFAEAGKRAQSDSPETLEAAFRAALSVLGRDPTAAPAHLFIGGKGIGGRAAAHLATSRLRVDGLFFLGFPLHTQDKPEQTHAEHLYRIIAPMLFVQGTRDRMCDLDTLRQTLKRVGAPTTLYVSEDADQNFHVPKRSSRDDEEVRRELVELVIGWFQKILSEG
jgi:predicted alpha/beta-hydrolase family hydrolase